MPEPIFAPSFQRRLEHLQILARRLARRRSERIRPLVWGEGVAFSEHRPYAPGDDPSRIDWLVYGRTGRLLTKRFEARGPIELLCIVDGSASMKGVCYRHAAQTACAVSTLAIRSGDRITLCRFGGAEPAVTSGRTRGTLERARRILEQPPAGEGTLISPPLLKRERGGVAIILSDFLYPAAVVERVVAHLHHHRFLPVLFRLRDEREVDRIPTGPVELVDRETERILSRNASRAARNALRQAAAVHERRLEAAAARHGGWFQAVDATGSFESTIISLLEAGFLV